MSAKVRCAHEIYADELFKRGHGYPLWEPDPAKDESEVQIGDVGYLQDGGFYRLFSAVQAQDHALNRAYGVPQGFAKFDFGQAQLKLKDNAIKSGPLWSQSVSQMSVGGGAGGSGAGQGLDLNLRYECTGQQGAMIILGSPASRYMAHSDRRMMQHMRRNVDQWYEFAISDGVGVNVQLEDLVFVRGWVKTTHWTVVAFDQSDHSVKATLSLKGNLGPGSVSADFHVDTNEITTHSVDYRIGPSDRFNPVGAQGVNARHSDRRQRDEGHNRVFGQQQTGIQNVGREAMSGGPEQWPADQCIFLHYFKAKKRRVWPGLKVMSAAAEPRDPSAHKDQDDDLVIEAMPAQENSHDPVIFLLDYILENSDANLAIASDIDLVEVCKIHHSSEYPIPNDIPAFLKELRPPIEMTEDGLGILQFDDDLTIESQDNPSAVDRRDDSAQDGSHGINGSEARQDDDKKVRANILLVPPSSGGGPRNGASALIYSPAGRDIAAGFEDSAIIVWSAATHDIKHQFSGHGAVTSLAFSPNGTTLVSGGDDGHVIIWDVISGGAVRTFQSDGCSVHHVACSPNGQLVASASSDYTVRLWEAETGVLRATTDAHGGAIMSILFSPDGERFVTTSVDGSAQVWSTMSATNICNLSGHNNIIYTIAYSHDGKRLVTAGEDGTARTWNALLGDETMVLRERKGSVWAATFSADGGVVYYVGSDGTMKACNSYTSDLLGTVEGGEKLSSTVAFSADGRLLGAGGEDYTITVWSTEHMTRIASFEAHADNICQICFSPNNRYVISASEDGTIFEFSLPAVGVTAVFAGGRN